MSKDKQPEIRFPGFTEDWEQRKLGDVFSERSERSSEGELISVTINSGVIKASELDRKDNSSDNKSNYKKVEVGDIAYNSMRMWQGASGYSSYEGILSPAYTVIIPKEGTDSKFFAYDFKRYDMIQTFKRNSQGLTSDTWNLKFPTLKLVKIMVPSIEEQKQIAAFFERLDNTIALHERELDVLKETKKGFLQKMFPKNGAKVPEIRFPGFTEDWEERKLNEVSDIYDGTHQTPKYQDDGVMFLSVENIKTLTSNKFISREAFEDEFKIRPQRGDVLMTRIGDIGTANVVETDEDLAYYVSLALFKSEELNPYFLQASIYAPFVQDQIWKRTLHIAFPKKINKNEIGQLPINVPTLAEQTKIGAFFKQLDDTIALHQRELDVLKETKKGFLQKMFV
ncbi:restriction endonuclease subunit S [Enterococcus hirae]|uniref:restriction endonuclease subunit S n=1 Tax=Enterococcus hirae TaxID=1354 RepID=UPI0039A53121